MNEIIIKKKKHWAKRLIKILFIAGILFAVIFTVLANVGGNSEPLKESVEQYITEITGHQARVGKLNSMNFFPMIIIDFEELNLMDGATVVAGADKIYLVSRFWDVTFRTRKIKALEIENFYAEPGIMMEQSFSIKKLGIESASETEAFFTGEGLIGEIPFVISEKLEVFGKQPRQLYRFPEGTILELKKEDGTVIPMEMENGMLVIKNP